MLCEDKSHEFNSNIQKNYQEIK